MHYVYILQSQKDKKYYIGYTEDIGERLLRHNRGGVKATASRMPWKVVYSESYENKLEAMQRERKIKSYKGGEAFKKLLISINGL